MPKTLSLAILFCVGAPFCGLSADDPCCIKNAISECQILAQNLPNEEKSQLMVKLASLYIKDQDLEKGILTFLEGLEATPPIKRKEVLEDLFDQEAMQIYLNHNLSSREMSKKILEKLVPKVQNILERPVLCFIVAAAYANLNNFEEFFGYFYQAYQMAPDHYLADKEIAILHIKLLERARTFEQREKLRSEITMRLESALNKFPQDHSLYKLNIVFGDEKKKANAVQTALNKIIDENMILPRSDIPFYIAAAVQTKQLDLAQRFFGKAKQWYQNSRILSQMQDYLNKQ